MAQDFVLNRQRFPPLKLVLPRLSADVSAVSTSSGCEPAREGEASESRGGRTRIGYDVQASDSDGVPCRGF